MRDFTMQHSIYIDGFFSYPHLLAVAISESKLTQTQLNIVSHLIDQTLKVGKIKARITQDDIAGKFQTGQSRVSVNLAKLVARNIVIKSNKKRVLELNLNIKEWLDEGEK